MSGRRRRTLVGRDQHVSAFGVVLMRLCDAVGAVGAALVDAEGETVDYAGAIDPFEIKIVAAEFTVLMEVVQQSGVPLWDQSKELLLRAARKSFFLRRLGEGYAIVLQLLPHAFHVSRRGLSEAVRDLCGEAGLELPEDFRTEPEQWARVEVRCPQGRRRPDAIWVDGGWCPLEVLGIYSEDLRENEVGYRARLATGAELTLVREPLGRWYADGLPGR